MNLRRSSDVMTVARRGISCNRRDGKGLSRIVRRCWTFGLCVQSLVKAEPAIFIAVFKEKKWSCLTRLSACHTAGAVKLT